MLKINQEYIKSPINYVGNKYRLIKQIIPLFPKKISMFVDAFGGSGTVLMNTEADHYIYNDVNPYVSGIVLGLFSTPYDEIIKQIESVISEYDLNKTSEIGFKHLRNDYNNGKKEWYILYSLMCFSFNWQMRFNNKHEYNSSWGKDRSSFTSKQKQGIYLLKQRFENKEPVTVSSKNALNFDFSDFDKNDLIYFDPPYFNSVGNYNDGKRGFEGFGCSFGGRFFEGYARNATGTNYAAQSKRSVMKDMSNLMNVEFTCLDYKDVEIPKGSIVYADPPYFGTKPISRQKFNTNEFWNYMREISKDNKVFISEQNAPNDFECIWEKPFTRTLDRNKNNQFKVTERLFTYKNSTLQ